MHPDAQSFVASLVEKTDPFGSSEMRKGLDVGGAIHTGSARSAWISIGARYEWDVLDIRPGPGVNIVADAAKWEPQEAYDVVLCTEVLEHTAQWREILNTCLAALSVGGHLILTCAGHNRAPHSYDGEPLKEDEHYENMNPNVLLLYLLGLRGFLIRSFRYEPGVGDIYIYATRGW